MSSDEEDVLCVLAIADLVLPPRRKLRFKVRPYLLVRNFNIYQELKIDDRFGIDNFFRVSESDFEELVSLIRPDVQKNSTWRNDVISSEMRLGITLRFLATGDSYTSLMYHLRISKQQISKIIPEVCWALHNKLKGLYLEVPSSQHEWKKISRGFDVRWNFPHAIGALDGKHVVMEAPENTGSLYYNYKKTFSVVLLAMVDYNYNFIYVDVGCQGRISDGGVFRNCSLYRALENGSSGIPISEPLPGREMSVPYVIIGDDAFPLSGYLMKPYSGEFQQGSRQRIFNYRLCRARRIVENAFGIMASVFQVFKKPLTVQVETVIPVILASVALHNYLRRNKSSANLYSPNGSFDAEDLETGQIIPGQWRPDQALAFEPLPVVPRRPPIDARIIRDELSMYFISADGMVPWQYNDN